MSLSSRRESNRKRETMPNSVTYQYVKQPRYGDDIRVRVVPRQQQPSLDQRLVAVAEMCVINQIAEDYATRFANLDIIKKKFHVHSNYINNRFGDVKRKMNRQMYNERDKGRFNDCICEIVDSCENNLKWVEMLSNDELAKVVDKERIEAVLCLSYANGFVSILKKVHLILYGKYYDEYDNIADELDAVRRSLCNGDANVGSMRMYDVENAINLAFKQIKEKCVAFVAQAKKEREAYVQAR